MRRGVARLFAKQPDEEADILVAHLVGNLANRQRGGQQQLLRPVDPDLLQVTDRRKPGGSTEATFQGTQRKAGLGGHTLQAEGLGVVGLDPVLQRKDALIAMVAATRQDRTQALRIGDQQVGGAELREAVASLPSDDFQQGIEAAAQGAGGIESVGLQVRTLADEAALRIAPGQLPNVGPVAGQQETVGAPAGGQPGGPGGEGEDPGTGVDPLRDPGQARRIRYEAGQPRSLDGGNHQQVAVRVDLQDRVRSQRMAAGDRHLAGRCKDAHSKGWLQADMRLQQGDDAEKVRHGEHPHPPATIVG